MFSRLQLINFWSHSPLPISKFRDIFSIHFWSSKKYVNCETLLECSSQTIAVITKNIKSFISKRLNFNLIIRLNLIRNKIQLRVYVLDKARLINSNKGGY